jgi:hypothetical protein
MAASDRRVGTTDVIHFLATGGTPGVDEKVLSADHTSFSENRVADIVDITAGNETTRTGKTTIEALDFTVMFFDADQSWLANVLPGAEGLLSVYKGGNTTGQPKHAYNVIFTGFSEDYPL